MPNYSVLLRRVVLASVIVVVLGGGAFAFSHYQIARTVDRVPLAVSAPETSSADSNLLPPAFVTDPERDPDAFVATRSLVDLPKDVLKQPLLKEVLTEDFVFYYLESPGYLSLKGSLKRIAFEHDLTLFDEVLGYALNAPAKVAFWKGYDGRLMHYLAVFDKNLVAGFLEALVKAAAADSQLTVVGERSADGEKFKVYKFAYAFERELYFASSSDRLVVYSHPETPLPTKARLKRWGEDVGVEDTKHSVRFSTRFLSFGYRKFFPSWNALRFRYAEKAGWSTQAMIAGKAPAGAYDTAELWMKVPKNPSFCAALPVDARALGELAEAAFKENAAEAKALATSVVSPVAVCWYPDSKLYAPLVVAKLTQETNLASVKKIFSRAIGNYEAGILTDEEKNRFEDEKRRRKAGEKIDDPVRASRFEPSLKVLEKKRGNATTFSRDVSSRYGLLDAKTHAHANLMRSPRYFEVRLAVGKDRIAFSPDARLVDQALSVAEKAYPAVADSLPVGTNAGLIVFPSRLAELLRQSTLDSLPAEQESVFSESVSRRLFPAFDRMKKVSAEAAFYPKSTEASASDHWEELKWRALAD